MKSRFVFVVDDDDAVRDSVGTLLEAHGFPVRSFASGEEFRRSNSQHRTACLLVDYHMPKMTGIELLDELKRRGFSYPSILITGLTDATIQRRAARAGGVKVLRQPAQPQG